MEDAAQIPAFAEFDQHFRNVRSSAGLAYFVTKELWRFTPVYCVKQFLMDTGRNQLVEAAQYDKYWGIGRHIYDSDILKDKDSWGRNILGKTLIKIRSALQENGVQD